MRRQIVECPSGCGGTLVVPESSEDLLAAGRAGSTLVFFCSKGCRVTVGYAGRLQAEPRHRPTSTSTPTTPTPTRTPATRTDDATTPARS